MKLTVINSGSQGNCYHLTCSKGRTLIIEAGEKLIKTKEALGFDLQGIEGLLVSHIHQ
jgi:hypothetical protein